MDRFWRRLQKHPKTTVLVVLIGALIVGGVLMYDRVSAPTSGTINVVAPPSGTTKAGAVLVSGNYISFERLSDYTPIAGAKLSESLLENFAFVNRQTLPPADLYVSVVPLPSGSLADESSYHFRQMNPDRYQASSLTIDGTQVPVMTDKSGGFYKVAYVVHGNLAAEVVISCSNSSDESLNADLTDVLQSLKWLRNG